MPPFHRCQLKTAPGNKKIRNPRGSLLHGYRFFAQLAGLDLQIDTASEGWRAFDELVEVRHEFSHLQDIRGLHTFSSLYLLKPTLVWFTSLVGQLFSQVGAAARSDALPEELRNIDIHIEESMLRAALRDTFDPDFIDLVAQDAGRSIGYLRHCFRVLNDETDFARAGLLAIPFIGDPRRQYHARIFAWSFSTNIEGVTNLLGGELKKAALREEVTLTENDRDLMAADLIEDRTVATAKVWSRELGYDRIPSQEAEDWAAVAQARGIRNRISHPKSAAHLLVDPREQVDLLRASQWFSGELLQTLLIDPDKWLAKTKQP